MTGRLILVHPPSEADIGMFGAADDDPGHAPWIALRNRIRRQGDTIATTWEMLDAVERADQVLFMSVPESLQRQPRGPRAMLRALRRRLARLPTSNDVWTRLRRAGRTAHASLFLWEPEVVAPETYEPGLHSHFSKVFTYSADLVERGGRYRPIICPLPSGVPAPREVPFAERKLLANFSGNKTSSHPLELYSARVEVIRYMETHHPDRFDHFGPGWSADFPSWRGTVESKFDVYPNYCFGLCYENTQRVRGYITEKIFDCLRAGTVPIYWGAPEIADVVDPAAFVDRRQFADTAAMISFLDAMGEATWSAMRTAGRRYLESEAFSRFLPDAFCDLILRELELAA